MNTEVHAATVALVVFVENDSLAPWARDRAQMLAERHTSRVLVLNAGMTEHETTHDASDWIELGVRGCAPERIGSLAESLLPGGLPRVLLWVASQTQSDDRFLSLAPQMAAVVTDSSRTKDDESALLDLAAYAAKHSGACKIHDLAYLRLAPWQEVVADFFDDRAFIEDLFELRRVTVASGSDAEGYYLLGWLASRLEWEPAGRCRFRHAQRDSVRTIDYGIVREGQARRVRRVTLESQGTQFQAELCESGKAVTLEVSGRKERASRVAPLHDVDIPSLLERAILQQENDRVFCDALEFAGRLPCEESA